jgi:hypothetical protein
VPERRIHRDRLVPGALVAVGSLRILPVERVALDAGGGGAAAWLVARKEPWALVIDDGSGARALGPDGVAVPLDAVRRRVPDLDDRLAAAPGVAPDRALL